MIYILREALNPSEIGHTFPQVQNTIGGSPYNLPPQDRPATDLNIPVFLLHSKSKKIDYISCSNSFFGMLVSPKLKNLLIKHKLPAHQVFPAKIKHYNKYYDYFLINIYEDALHYIDFEASRFYQGTAAGSWTKDININSIEEYTRMSKNMPQMSDGMDTFVLISELRLREDIIDTDVFRLRRLLTHYFVSEKLKNELIENHITGVDFIPVDQLKISITPHPLYNK